MLRLFLNFIFPVKCFDCGIEGVSFCEGCFAALPARTREARPAAFALFDYRHPPLARAIWSLKYRGNRDVARLFAAALYDILLERFSDEVLFAGQSRSDFALLVPIPRAWWRKRRYGFNQTEMLARELVRLDGGEGRTFALETRALVRTGWFVKSQTKIKDRAARVKNARGAFSVRHPERVKGRLVILIDDIYTTGATIEEAKKALRKAGAKKVFAYTVAH